MRLPDPYQPLSAGRSVICRNHVCFSFGALLVVGEGKHLHFFDNRSPAIDICPFLFILHQFVRPVPHSLFGVAKRCSTLSLPTPTAQKQSSYHVRFDRKQSFVTEFRHHFGQDHWRRYLS